MPFRIQFLFFLSLLLAGVACDSSLISDSAREEYGESFSITKAIDNRENIFISNINGNIKVVGVDGLREAILSGMNVVRDLTTERAREHVRRHPDQPSMMQLSWLDFENGTSAD